ncbi:hypothetical protein WR25_15996 [Diploscapter pachys]|uniref:Uncharacterized protein n=1 Tax=Diploscapter pachys TaxID=2018661 RepID=A0A2A2KQ84_9BILA|nr:hypothetical protein WR25_15996 [Diploscapter pachys]
MSASSLPLCSSSAFSSRQVFHYKLPSVYGPLLRKEGVTHEIGKLAAVLKEEIKCKNQSSSSVEDIKQEALKTFGLQEKSRTKKSKKKLEKAVEEAGNGTGSGSGEDEPIAARTRKRSSPESSNSSKSSNSSTASSKVSRLKLSSTPLSSRSATVSTGTSQTATEPGPSSLSAPQQSPNQPGPSSSSAPSSPLFPSSSATPAQPVNQQRNSTIPESDSNPNLIVRNILDQIGCHMQFFLISATTSGLPSRFSSFAPMSSAENAPTALSIRNIDRIKQHFKEEENGSVLEALSQIAKELSSRNEDKGIDSILQLYNTLKQVGLQIFE